MDIDYEFPHLPNLQEIISRLAARGATLTPDGMIIATTDGDFTWESRPAEDLGEAVAEMERTIARRLCVGFVVAWPGSRRSGHVLLMPESATISFSPDVGTLAYGSDPSSVGLGWYLDELGETVRPMRPIAMNATNRL